MRDAINCIPWIVQLVMAPVLSGLQLESWYAPHMVVQRDKPIVIRGTSEVDGLVEVELLEVDTATGDRVLDVGDAHMDTAGFWQIRMGSHPASTLEQRLALVVRQGASEVRMEPIHIGDLWICAGQSNMNFLMRPYLPWSEGIYDWEAEVMLAGDPLLNVFTVVPEADWQVSTAVQGSWRPDTPLYSAYFSAVPYLLGRGLRRETQVPIGIVVAALGATSIQSWMHREALEPLPAAQSDLTLHDNRRVQYAEEIADYYSNSLPEYRHRAVAHHWQPTYAAALPDPYPSWRHQSGGLYHAMLAPLEPIPVTGVAWYQGESDSTQHAVYADYLLALIQSWRDRRQQPDLPFLVVQIANHDPVLTGADPAVHTDTRAALRAAQSRVLELGNTALIVTADVGNPSNIHPRDKATVALRLGLAAMHLAYGQTDRVYHGPLLSHSRVDNGRFELAFVGFGGDLVIDTDRASGGGPDFVVAGADRHFHSAQYRLTASGLQVWSDAVDAPVYLRYAYHNDPRLILYNAEGLPAAPFSVSLPMQTMVTFAFDDSNLLAQAPLHSLREATLSFGAGLAAGGYNASRGTPPPSLFIRTTATPDSYAQALASDAYLEVRMVCQPGYHLDLARGGFAFDLARSTGLGEFAYAVRSSLDSFQTTLTSAPITTANEQFGTVFVPLPQASFVSEIALRIYLWDDWNDSLRAVRLDNLRFMGQPLFIPQTRIQQATDTQLQLTWHGVPGRSYAIYSATSLPISPAQQSMETSSPVDSSGHGHHLVEWPAGSRFFSIVELP